MGLGLLVSDYVAGGRSAKTFYSPSINYPGLRWDDQITGWGNWQKQGPLAVQVGYFLRPSLKIDQGPLALVSDLWYARSFRGPDAWHDPPGEHILYTSGSVAWLPEHDPSIPLAFLSHNSTIDHGWQILDNMH